MVLNIQNEKICLLFFIGYFNERLFIHKLDFGIDCANVVYINGIYILSCPVELNYFYI